MRAFKWTGVGSLEPSTPGDISSVDLIALSAGDIGRDEVASVLTEDLSGQRQRVAVTPDAAARPGITEIVGGGEVGPGYLGVIELPADDPRCRTVAEILGRGYSGEASTVAASLRALAQRAGSVRIVGVLPDVVQGLRVSELVGELEHGDPRSELIVNSVVAAAHSVAFALNGSPPNTICLCCEQPPHAPECPCRSK